MELDTGLAWDPNLLPFLMRGEDNCLHACKHRYGVGALWSQMTNVTVVGPTSASARKHAPRAKLTGLMLRVLHFALGCPTLAIMAASVPAIAGTHAGRGVHDTGDGGAAAAAAAAAVAAATAAAAVVIANASSIEYRLGDLFWGNFKWTARMQLARDYAGSIGAQYVHATTISHKARDVASIAAAVRQARQRCSASEGADASVALHLRIGDVACGTSLAESSKRPFPPRVYQAIRATWPTVPVVVFAAVHASSSSSQGTCVNASYDYVRDVINVVNGAVSLAPRASVDCDVRAMIDAEHFVQGQGCFSSLVAALRLHLGRPVTRLRGSKDHWYCNATGLREQMLGRRGDIDYIPHRAAG